MPVDSLATIGCTPRAIAAGNDVPMYIGRRNVEGGGRQQSFANSTFRGVAGRAWRDQRRLELRRLGRSTRRSRPIDSTLNYFVTTASPARDARCRSTSVRRADLPFRASDGTDPNCVPYNPFKPGGVTQEAARLPPGARHPDRAHRPGDLQRHQSPVTSARTACKSPLGVGRRAGGVRRRVAPRRAREHGRRAAGTGSARRAPAAPTIGICGRDEGRRTASPKCAFRSSRTSRSPRACRSTPRIATRTTATASRPTPTSSASSGRRSRTSASAAATSGGPCGQRRRAVHGAGLQPVRHDGRSLRRRCSGSGSDACGVHRARASRQADSARRDAALDSPAGQYNFLQGGNTDADAGRGGHVLVRHRLHAALRAGPRVTVDYFDIKIDDTISTFGAENTLNACYINNDAAACARINRNPGRPAVGRQRQRRGYQHQHRFAADEGLRPQRDLHRTGDRPLRQPELQPDRHVAGRADHRAGPGHRPVRLRRRSTRDDLRHAEARVASPVPHELGDAVGSRPVAHVALLRLDVERLRRFDPGTASTTSCSAERLLRPRGQLGDHGEGLGRRSASTTCWTTIRRSARRVGTTGNGNTYPQTYDALGRYVFVRATVDF